MFICSNLKAAGIEYQGKTFQGEYFGYFNNEHTEQLAGVIVHYWNGNVIMYADNESVLEKLTIYLKHSQKRHIAGILGPNRQAEHVIKVLDLSAASFSINRHEELYQIDLATLKELEASSNFEVVSAQNVSQDVLMEWRRAYNIEALGGSISSDLESMLLAEVERLRHNDGWVLLLDGTPVSLSAFNARLEELVQVGSVWTPPEHRNKGFARMLLTYILFQENIKGTKQAILFSSNPIAIKLYLSIGFKKIGDYRLALLNKPIIVREQVK